MSRMAGEEEEFLKEFDRELDAAVEYGRDKGEPASDQRQEEGSTRMQDDEQNSSGDEEAYDQERSASVNSDMVTDKASQSGGDSNEGFSEVLFDSR